LALLVAAVGRDKADLETVRDGAGLLVQAGRFRDAINRIDGSAGCPT
jgi:hypothetical protein